MAIDFKRETLTAEYLDPARNFERHSFPLEVRTDPLTGQQGTVFHSSIAARRYQPDPAEVAALVQRSTELGCPFCPGALERGAPRFVPEFAAEGIISQGEARLFPNRDLFHTPFSAILILSPQHYIELGGFTPELLANGFEAAQLYFRRLTEYQPAATFHTINWNYFPAAGGSIVHSHLQLLGSPIPHNRHAQLLTASQQYLVQNGTNYWAELIAAEKEQQERYIGRSGRVCWLAPFVPRGRLWDVVGIFEGGGSLLELSPQDCLDLAQGITRVLKFIHSQGLYSFNFSLLSSVKGDNSFWTQGFILPRTITPPMGMSDCSYLDTLLDHPSSAIFPEEIAQELREHFI